MRAQAPACPGAPVASIGPDQCDEDGVSEAAAAGIGQAVCRELAGRGASVVAVDLQEPAETLALLDAADHTAVGIRADVSDPERTGHVGEEVRSRYGRCAILVKNAGIYPRYDIDDLDYATWRRVLAVNPDSQFLMVKALLPLMKDGGWGRIVRSFDQGGPEQKRERCRW